MNPSFKCECGFEVEKKADMYRCTSDKCPHAEHFESEFFGLPEWLIEVESESNEP